MSTYPRTYDLIHAYSLFTMYKDRYWILLLFLVLNFAVAPAMKLAETIAVLCMSSDVKWRTFCWRWTVC